MKIKASNVAENYFNTGFILPYSENKARLLHSDWSEGVAI